MKHEMTRERVYWTIKAMLQDEKAEVTEKVSPKLAQHQRDTRDEYLACAEASATIPGFARDDAERLFRAAQKLMLS